MVESIKTDWKTELHSIYYIRVVRETDISVAPSLQKRYFLRGYNQDKGKVELILASDTSKSDLLILARKLRDQIERESGHSCTIETRVRDKTVTRIMDDDTLRKDPLSYNPLASKEKSPASTKGSSEQFGSLNR
jgi:hypothetical protein